MGIEGGPRLADQLSTRIEGEPIGAFIETTIDQADPVQLEDIEWSKFSAGLHFKQVGIYNYKRRFGFTEPYPLYTCLSWFNKSGSTQKIDLSHTTPRNNVYLPVQEMVSLCTTLHG